MRQLRTASPRHAPSRAAPTRPARSRPAAARGLLALLALAAPLATARAQADGAATRVDSRIVSVVVHTAGARVTRRAEASASGRVLLAGLPGTLDPDSVRVRLAQGSLVGVEVTGRITRAASDAKLQRAREALQALREDERAAKDERQLQLVLKESVQRILQPAAPEKDGAATEPWLHPDSWSTALAFVEKETARLDKALREVDSRLAGLSASIRDAEADLGRLGAAADQRSRDVTLDLVVPGATPVEVEYFVPSASWLPLYDLRAAADGTAVALTYRARVTQTTGEDWDDVALFLSTAQPQTGARGPDPRPLALSLREAGRGGMPAPSAPAAVKATRESALEALGYLGAADEAPPEAAVIDSGLAVQFALPRRESVPSRDRASSVLIGEAELPVEIERQVVPSLDTTVWVRGRTRNATAWTMLPGRASVYFGQDYVGPADFDRAVQPDEAFTLHLGADPALKVERRQTADLTEPPGFLSNRTVRTEAWSVTLANTGARPARPDGSVAVIVREAIPRPADERLEVEVKDESVAPSRDARWKQDQDDLGLRTWIVGVPAGGKVELRYAVETRWPPDSQLVTYPVPVSR